MPSDQSEVEEDDHIDDVETPQIAAADISSSSSMSSDKKIPALRVQLNVQGQRRGRGRVQSRERHCVNRSQSLNDILENMGKDGTRWQATQLRTASVGRFSDQNILWRRPGPTAYAATRIVVDQEVSAFQIFFNEVVVRHICKCTTAESR